MKLFPRLWKTADWRDSQYIVTDKGYDYSAVRQVIRQTGKIPVIPGRNNTVVPGVRDVLRYKTRAAIERLFAQVKKINA